MKRFTETTKWDDPWFRNLPPEAKLFWDWICSKCDHAGVIEPDYDLAGFQIGIKIGPEIIQHFEGRIEMIDSGKLFVSKFIQFQYGKLSRSCKPHAPVFAALEKHGISSNGVLQNENYKETVDDSMRQKVIKRDGLFCAYYGIPITEKDAVIDHIKPRSRGGKATMDNLVVASFAANSKKWYYSVHQFCEASGLDFESVCQRLSKATGKPARDFVDDQESLPDRLKEKEKEKRKDKDKDQDKDQDKGQDRFIAEMAEIDQILDEPVMPRQAAGSMLKLEERVRGLKADWKLPLTRAEQEDLMGCARAIQDLTDSDWAIIKAYLGARLPQGSPGWQPRSRAKFLQSAPDVWAHASEWHRKNHKPAKEGIWR